MAALSVIYSNFCGMVVSETRSGVESDYVSDPLGSTIGLMGVTGTMTDRWEYWPWGEVVSRTGTNATPLTFLGILGYFKDVLDKLFYVRARHLRADLAKWLTVDPLWPNEQAYVYANEQPVSRVDPSGRVAVIIVAGCVVACAACAVCLAGFISSCSGCNTPPCWAQCLQNIWNNLSGTWQWICGGACAGCLACLVAAAIAYCTQSGSHLAANETSPCTYWACIGICAASRCAGLTGQALQNCITAKCVLTPPPFGCQGMKN